VQVEKPKLQKRSRSARRRHWIIGQNARWLQSQDCCATVICAVRQPSRTKKQL